MKDLLDSITPDLAALTPADQARVADYVAFLRWRAEQHPAGLSKAEGSARPWHFNFLEHLAEADVHAARERAGMEVKAAEATVGGLSRPALWQHPPVSGEALAEFHVPVPAGVKNLRLRFSIGIRDGAEAAERLVAFRIKVDGWQVWSRAAYPHVWEPFEVALPLHAGNILRLAFATDGLGEHQFAWAAWGEPELTGTENGN